jgi:hypothetical protein
LFILVQPSQQIVYPISPRISQLVLSFILNRF